MASNSKSISVFLIHYSKLKDRKSYLEESPVMRFDPIWITEERIQGIELKSNSNIISARRSLLLGFVFMVNIRSKTISRRNSIFIELLRFAKYLFLFQYEKYMSIAFPFKTPLGSRWQEVIQMHLTAIKEGLKRDSDWIVVIEDDAIFQDNFAKTLNHLRQRDPNSLTWMNLNTCSNLDWTNSDPDPDEFGFFRVWPRSAKALTSYVVSKPLAEFFVKAIQNGVPENLPADQIYQNILFESRAKTLWQTPPSILQGSETGHYTSQFETERKSN